MLTRTARLTRGSQQVGGEEYRVYAKCCRAPHGGADVRGVGHAFKNGDAASSGHGGEELGCTQLRGAAHGAEDATRHVVANEFGYLLMGENIDGEVVDRPYLEMAGMLEDLGARHALDEPHKVRLRLDLPLFEQEGEGLEPLCDREPNDLLALSDEHTRGGLESAPELAISKTRVDVKARVACGVDANDAHALIPLLWSRGRRRGGSMPARIGTNVAIC